MEVHVFAGNQLCSADETSKMGILEVLSECLLWSSFSSPALSLTSHVINSCI